VAVSVPIAEIDRQRELGWPDFHPEDFCHRCGGRNVCWYAPSPLWNIVMSYPHERWNGIICPQCFMELAEAAGLVKAWRLSFAMSGGKPWGLTGELPSHSPDGREYDWQSDLWQEEKRRDR
jgi:hypothetical protein